MKQIALFFLLFFVMSHSANAAPNNQEPIRLAVAGMSHGHISFILDRPDNGNFKLVGVYDSSRTVTQKRAGQYDLSDDMIYHNLEVLLDETQPEAVAAFGSIHAHLAVVEACAPRGIDVMVEKPLAVSMEHARRMEKLAKKHDIHLLTNYETSWYPTTIKSLNMVQEDNFTGQLRKAVFHHGHRGPVEIGCSQIFLEWLTDPVLNGGGAIIDFGCYGANIMTALTKGKKPVSVTAVTRHYKPEIYPEVDDEATIIVSYPESKCIIQASWNWPFSRKDMEIYGTDGYIKADNNRDMRIRSREIQDEKKLRVTADDVAVYEDPFNYFADVINGKIQVDPYGLYSLENNLRVVEILDAARQSAETGKTIYLR
ncbi:MAG: Gfo/Idh/MocA family oxidoreductase [Bacteroidales bacterium]